MMVGRKPGLHDVAVQSLILVLGCQRSGTTLIGQILGAHEEAALIDEFEGLYPWFHALAAKSPDTLAQTAQVLSRSMTKYCRPEERFIQLESGIGLADKVQTLVLKAPNLTYDFDKVARLGVSARVIWPHRDPRAVVVSMLRLSHIDFAGNQLKLITSTPGIQELFPTEVAVLADRSSPHWLRAVMIWRVKTGIAQRFGASGVPLLRVPYEALVANPQEWVGRMLTFCDLPASSLARAHESVYQGTGPGGTDRTRAIDEASLLSWHHALEESEARAILEASQPLAAELGYG